MAKKEKKRKKKRQAKRASGQKSEASSSPTRELELLKSELTSLVCKYEHWLINMIIISNPLHVELK
jgi:hypothetical protein